MRVHQGTSLRTLAMMSSLPLRFLAASILPVKGEDEEDDIGNGFFTEDAYWNHVKSDQARATLPCGGGSGASRWRALLTWPM